MNEMKLYPETLIAAAVNRARNAGYVRPGNEDEGKMRRERLLVASGEHPKINLKNGYLDMVAKAQHFEAQDKNFFQSEAEWGALVS